MGTVALTGKDTHKINGRILNDFAPGDCVMIEYESDLMTAKRGKNGNTIYALNENGKLCKATYRLIAGGPDDKFFQGLLAVLENDPPAFVLINAESQKRIGGGNGSVTPITYLMDGGVIKKRPGMKDNAEGDTEQAVVIYELIFGNVARTIG